MGQNVNEYGQPVGEPLSGWTARARPERTTLQGRFCRLEPLNADVHGVELYKAYRHAPDWRDWTYYPVGPFDTEAGYLAYAREAAGSSDDLHYAVIDLATGRPVGTLALIRVDPASGAIEVGYVNFSPLLKQTPVSTEAQFLLMRYVFDGLGYRRYEWKCDALNAPSRKTATRLGFTFEGIFRQVTVYKGRNRDTAWFAIIDKDWPEVKRAFEQWLAPDNFTSEGVQRTSLSAKREKSV